MNPLRWFGLINDDDHPSLLADLRQGSIGIPGRAVLSLCSGLVLAALVAFAIGIVETTAGRIDDEIMLVVIMVAGGLWCVSLLLIWANVRRYGLILRTAILIIGIWAVVIPTGVLMDELFGRAEALIAGVILLGFASSFFVGFSAWHRGRRGRTIKPRTGPVHVHCPACSYSLVGLSASTCPECGWSAPLDELIAAQNYEALRDRPRTAKPAPTSTVDAEPQIPPGAAPASAE